MNGTAIPFSAAIFDLDGTLLDSNWVWKDVDRRFFAARGIPCAWEDYARAVQGMSFREAAAYTVERFGLREGVEEVMDEWLRMTREAYARRVELKRGALEYLRGLKRAGVKLAVATANRAELFMPALARCGADMLFDAFCTSAEVGDTSKANGALYMLAASRLGVAPGDCAVFEDVLEGVKGARRAGMRSFALRDAATEHSRGEIAALADGVVEDFSQMSRFHALPEPGRCVIFTARCEGDPTRACVPREGDCVLCADGGWQLARRAGVKPELVIGDFDSSDEPAGEATLRVPVEKDDTDTMLCLKRGLEMGFGDFLIVGGFGGRVDHTLANLQALRYAAKRRARAVMCDGLSWATVIENGEVRVPADVLGPRGRKLSVFALGDACRGVTIRGAKYPLAGGALTGDFPLGVSNEFAGEAAWISVEEGTLLVTVCGE